MPIDFRASQIETNKIISSGSTGTPTGARLVVYPHIADDGTAPNQGFINQSVFVTSSIGTDIFLYVSGGIGERNVGGAQSITCFGGDVHISGNLTVDGTSPSGGGGTNFFWSPLINIIEASGSLTITGSGYFKSGLSGSLQEISPGVPYLLAGPNITIATNSLGQVSITGSAAGGGGSSFYRLEVLDYYSTNATIDTTAGQVIFPANQFTGSIVLYGVIANSSATATGSVRLYNVTSGSYVEIGGIGNQYLSVSGTTPTIVSSVNLISASNFNSSSQAIYELQVSSSNGASYGFFGGFELRPSGSFTGVTYMTSSTYYTYVSGTWEDGGNKLATTSSVAMSGLQGPGFFANNVGADVFFYVSGSSGSKDSATPGVAVFGGDVVISGVLHGGSPLKIGSPAKFFQGLSGSITTLTDGSSYLVAGNGISVTSASNGSVTIASNVATLQQSYNAGLPLVGLNDSSGSITITGSLNPIAAFYPPLLNLKPGFGGPYGSNYSAIDVFGYLYTESNSASLINIAGYGSNAGGGAITLRSTGDVNGRIGWIAGPGELYGTALTAEIQYHPNANSLKFKAVGAGKKVIIEDGSGYGGNLLITQNAAVADGGTIELLPSKSLGFVINSGSLEQSGSASFKNKVEITGSLSNGQLIQATGNFSHAEGYSTTASGSYSHAEGFQTQALGDGSHAEGYQTIATGSYSHAEGSGSISIGTFSYAGGDNTIASGSCQTVIGSYNLENNTNSLFVIGDGKYVITQAFRGDILRVNKGSSPGDGIVEITGSLSVSGSGGSNGTFNQYSGLRYYPKIVTSLPYTASLNDYIIAVSASTGDGVALPSGAEYGRTFIVKDVSGSAGQNLLTVTAQSGELIDGAPSAIIAIDYGSAKFVYFGSAIGWGII